MNFKNVKLAKKLYELHKNCWTLKFKFYNFIKKMIFFDSSASKLWAKFFHLHAKVFKYTEKTSLLLQEKSFWSKKENLLAAMQKSICCKRNNFFEMKNSIFCPENINMLDSHRKLTAFLSKVFRKFTKTRVFAEFQKFSIICKIWWICQEEILLFLRCKKIYPSRKKARLQQIFLREKKSSCCKRNSRRFPREARG